MPHGQRTKQGDALRLQFKEKRLKCDVGGPDTNGEHWLRFYLLPSEGTVEGEENIAHEIADDVEFELSSMQNIRVTIQSTFYDDDRKCFVHEACFPPEDLTTAQEFQRTFGQQRPGPTR